MSEIILTQGHQRRQSPQSTGFCQALEAMALCTLCKDKTWADRLQRWVPD